MNVHSAYAHSANVTQRGALYLRVSTARQAVRALATEARSQLRLGKGGYRRESAFPVLFRSGGPKPMKQRTTSTL